MAFVGSHDPGYSIPATVYYVSPTGTGTGNDPSTPMGISSFRSTLATAIPRARFFLLGGVYEISTTLTISAPWVEIYGSGGADDAAPDTRILGTTTYTSGWTNVTGNVYKRTLSGVKAVYVDDQTAYDADLNSRAILLTRNTGTPGAPGANEWGETGGELFINIGVDPSDRTIRVATTALSIFTIAQGAQDVTISGMEVGMCAGHGIICAASQDANIRTLANLTLNNVWTFGTIDQTVSAGSVASNGVTIQTPTYVRAKGCVFDIAENDCFSLKQASVAELTNCYFYRAQDDGVSNHYQSHMELKNCIIRDVRTNASTDGNGITVFGGATANIENCTVLTDAGNGILVTNTAATSTVPNHVTIKDTVVRTITPGTGTGANGVALVGRGNVTCIGVDASFWQSTTAGQGFGFRFEDGALSAGVTSFMTLKDCISQRCRAAISTAQANANNRLFMHVSNITMADHSVTNVSNGGAAALAQAGTTTDTKSFYIS